MDKDLEHKILMTTRAKGKSQILIGGVILAGSVAVLTNTLVCDIVNSNSGFFKTNADYFKYFAEHKNGFFRGGIIGLDLGLAYYLCGKIKRWIYTK